MEREGGNTSNPLVEFPHPPSVTSPHHHIFFVLLPRRSWINDYKVHAHARDPHTTLGNHFGGGGVLLCEVILPINDMRSKIPDTVFTELCQCITNDIK